MYVLVVCTYVYIPIYNNSFGLGFRLGLGVYIPPDAVTRVAHATINTVFFINNSYLFTVYRDVHSLRVNTSTYIPEVDYIVPGTPHKASEKKKVWPTLLPPHTSAGQKKTAYRYADLHRHKN